MPDTANSRFEQLSAWLAGLLGPAIELRPITGDASLRRYFRVRHETSTELGEKFGTKPLIAMDSPPSEAHIDSFLDVAARLRAAGLHAPAIYASDAELGFILLEDLGDDMLKAHLHADSGDALMQRLLPLLRTMASEVDCQGLPEYSAQLLCREQELFPQWFADRHCEQAFSPEEQALWDSLSDLLIDNAQAQPQVFVHRDFHSCNLHALADGTTGIIDFQDAVHGPISYDLASWLWDRYQRWPRQQLERWMQEAYQAFGGREVLHCDADTWQSRCDLMGLQRNLKIVGVFCRLHYRDNKDGYLDMLPQFIAYVRDVLPRYPQLQAYRPLLESRL